MYIAESKSRKRQIQLLGIFVILLIGLILLWSARDQLIAQRFQQTQPGSIDRSGDASTGRAQAITNLDGALQNKAFTADLYEVDVQDETHNNIQGWQGIDGRIGIETYTVEEGDTLWGIAAEFGLDIDTLRWSNPSLEANPDLLSPGLDLVILPVIGAYHIVAPDEDLETIATEYGVGIIDILNYPPNGLISPEQLKVDQALIIPNGRKGIVLSPPELDLDYPLAWPVAGGITQNFYNQHRGLDIGAPYGSSVYASEAGTVVYAKWAQTGYGFAVIIDHGDNLKTLYAHLKGASVNQGDYVERGQVIGEVGSTGNSTGPHVHFEVRDFGRRVNPREYIK